MMRGELGEPTPPRNGPSMTRVTVSVDIRTPHAYRAMSELLDLAQDIALRPEDPPF